MTPSSSPESARPPQSRLWVTIKALFRARVTAGLVTLLPVLITFWLVRALFFWMRDASLWLIEAYLRSPWGHDVLDTWHVKPEDVATIGLAALPPGVRWAVSILSVCLTIVLLYVVGMFAANFFGRRIIEQLERVVEGLPLIKTVYKAMKQILSLFSGEQEQGFQRVALVPFPNEATRTIGFVTSIHRDTRTGEELCTVFVATAPNPTTGFVFVLRRTDVIEVDWTIEEAVRMVMSGGILTPESITMAHAAAAPKLTK